MFGRTACRPSQSQCSAPTAPGRGKRDNLVKKHWPALRAAGLATGEPATIYRADKRSARLYFVEIFSWKDGQASVIAHQTPEVRAIWGPMEPLLESMELAIIEPVGKGPSPKKHARKSTGATP